MKKWMGLMAAGFLMVSASVQAAGNVRAGLKAGASLAKVTGADAVDAKNLTGLVGGAFLGIKLNTLVIQPEILYSMKGTEVSASKIKLAYLEVPVLLKMSFPSPKFSPNLFVGPNLGFLVSAKEVVDSVSTDIKSGLKSIDFGIVAGVGVDIKKISLDVRYTMGLSKLDDSPSAQDLKNGVFSALVGYSFL